MSYRYAIYAAPTPGEALHERASRWLGRDAAGTAQYDTSPLPALDHARWKAQTAEARFYGFHATLKPPFRLHDSASEEALDRALGDFAHQTAAVSVPLDVACLSGFVALRPPADVGAVPALAASAVEHFDGFRAPAGGGELARRRAAGLTPRQEDNLTRWGYPWVMDDFRLHFTLTARLADSEREAVQPSLRTWFAESLAAPFNLDTIWLFVQPAPDAPFRQHRGYRLAGRPAPARRVAPLQQQYYSSMAD